MLNSHYCEIKVSRAKARHDWLSSIEMLRHRVRVYPYEGHDAVTIIRNGVAEPVALLDLTRPEIDRLLSVPAVEMACYGVTL